MLNPVSSFLIAVLLLLSDVSLHSLLVLSVCDPADSWTWLAHSHLPIYPVSGCLCFAGPRLVAEFSLVQPLQPLESAVFCL